MYVYLASPYSDEQKSTREWRYKQAEVFTARKLAEGITIYSPIVHCHHLALGHELPKDFEFWKEHNYNMLKPCQELWVLMIPGWRDSKGVREEIEFAQELNKLVTLVTPIQ
jgi:hypothetical protein